MYKTALRFVFFSCFSLAYFSSFAQKNLIRAEEMYNEESYRKALAYAEKAIEDDASRKNPYSQIIYSKILFELSKDIYFIEKEPKALDKAVKAMLKAKRKDSTSLYDHATYLDTLCRHYNLKGDKLFNINKYSQAIKVFNITRSLNGNWKSLNMIGKANMYMYDTIEGERYFDKFIDLTVEESGKEESNFNYKSTEPFEYYGNKYWELKKYDSANYYLELANSIFGKTKEIDFFLYKVALEQINEIPPSNLMMEIIDKSLSHFPTDTVLVKKQNALYIYLLKNYVKQHNTVTADTLLSKFKREKSARHQSKDVKALKKYDDFVSEQANDAIWKLSRYLEKNNHNSAATYCLDDYIANTGKTDLEARWVKMADYAFKQEDLHFAEFVISRALSKFPSNSGISSTRKNAISTYVERQNISLDDKRSLIKLMRQELPITGNTEDYLKKVSELIELYIKNDNFEDARDLINVTNEMPPEDRQAQMIYLAKEDFYDNYYESRTIFVDIDGSKRNEYRWSGSTSSCEEGVVEKKIQDKVAMRINYFRRNANLPTIALHPDLNSHCQKAALMMEANKKLDHQPEKSWRCFSKDGAYAARVSLLTKDVNTSIAVTSFMADNQNTSVGNRRWLLYPNGELFGHGSTDNYAVIWAVDDSGSTDSTVYEKQFVAWPPEGWTPDKMVFKNWSFSLYNDMEGASVRMTMNGVDIPLQMHKPVDGYGMPTLVWTPQLNLRELDKEAVIDVSVRLSDGKQYNYAVGIFQFNPVGY